MAIFQELKKVAMRVTPYRLFLKVFVWFWSVAVALLVLVWLGFMSTGLKNVTAPNAYAAVAPLLASKAIEAYETQGPAGFQGFIDDSGGPGRGLYLLDGAFHDVLSRPVTPEGLLTAHAAKLRQLMIYRGHIAAFRAISPTGRPYVLLLYVRGDLTELSHFLTGNGAPFGIMMCCVVFLFSAWFAHHIASPVRALQNTARRVAQGDLETRVPLFITRRHDELALLGADFDSMVVQLEVLLRTQRDLLSAVSHEVRSPLARMTLTLALLKRRAGGGFDDLLYRLETEFGKIDVLVSQLLLLSRLEANLSSTTKSDIHLADLLQEVVDDASFESDSMDKQVLLHVVDEVTLLHADASAIRSAVENVVRNALRFTQQRSTVLVALVLDDEASPERCHIVTSDEGPGVPQESLAAMFQPFTQVHTDGDMQRGNGLGLAIAQQAVRLHGGSIHAENRATGGLCVTIALPLQPIDR